MTFAPAVLRGLQRRSSPRLRILPQGLIQRRSLASGSPDVTLTIDGKSVTVKPGTAIIQACEQVGVEIPRFCYHERLGIAGNCRMCLVQVEKMPKPVASCAMPVTPGMNVMTETPVVKQAREGVMEFLLANHPLDCPICDQGGECDLQDISVRYGSDRSRFKEPLGKRATEDKYFGPLVKTTMTRCIHCTRCVRFSNEVAGAEELGTSGRGNDMQISTYIEKAISSEMSGNLVDLCPVGALTSKPYEFKSRPWELYKAESIDVHDAVGSHIRVDYRGTEVMRILPRINEDLNEEWINDKTRFAYDGLKTQRLTTPLIKQGDSFVAAHWKDALKYTADVMHAIPPDEWLAVTGQLQEIESMVALKDLFNSFGAENFAIDQLPSTPNTTFRSGYVTNSTIAGIEDADALLLVGTNPRHEAASLNSRIRKAYIHYGLDIGLIGPLPDLNYEVDHIGNDASALDNLKSFEKKFEQAERPMIIVGSGVLRHPDAQAIFHRIQALAKKYPKLVQPEWNGINFLQLGASHTGALDIGFHSTSMSSKKAPSLIYLLAADDFDPSVFFNAAQNPFVIYQGHHGDLAAQYANVIFPGAAYTEKSGIYVNTEGRAQYGRQAVTPPGMAREDWTIVRALSEMSGHTLPYDDKPSLHDRIADIAPHLLEFRRLEQPNFIKHVLSSWSCRKPPTVSKVPLEPRVADFYLTNSIARASKTMARCSKEFTHKSIDVEREILEAQAQA